MNERGFCRVKRIIVIASICIVIIGALSGCASLTNPGILDGYTDCEEHFDSDGFQDYTDYCKYYYGDSKTWDQFEQSSLYEPVGERIDLVKGYFENMEDWMDTQERSDEFDFDPACITAGDYVYIDSEYPENGPNQYSNYDVYLFDVEEHVLYFVHNNI